MSNRPPEHRTAKRWPKRILQRCGTWMIVRGPSGRGYLVEWGGRQVSTILDSGEIEERTGVRLP